MTPDPLPELAGYPLVMTTAQVAEALNLSHQLVIKHMGTGRLPGFKVGGSWRVRRADIQAVMEGDWKPLQPVEDDREDGDDE